MTISVTANGADRSHIERRKAILEKYPQVRQLFGRDETTFKITAAIFVGQMVVAAFLGWLGLSYWPLTLLLAIGVGAFANHANFVIIHDAIHNCVFESHLLNKWTAILADLSNGFPTAMGFRCYHIKHHSHLSAYDYDADVPSQAQGGVAVFLPGDSAGASVAAEGHGADHGQMDLYQHRGHRRLRYLRAVGLRA